MVANKRSERRESRRSLETEKRGGLCSAGADVVSISLLVGRCKSPKTGVAYISQVRRSLCGKKEMQKNSKRKRTQLTLSKPTRAQYTLHTLI